MNAKGDIDQDYGQIDTYMVAMDGFLEVASKTIVEHKKFSTHIVKENLVDWLRSNLEHHPKVSNQCKRSFDQTSAKSLALCSEMTQRTDLGGNSVPTEIFVSNDNRLKYKKIPGKKCTSSVHFTLHQEDADTLYTGIKIPQGRYVEICNIFCSQRESSTNQLRENKDSKNRCLSRKSKYIEGPIVIRCKNRFSYEFEILSKRPISTDLIHRKLPTAKCRCAEKVLHVPEIHVEEIFCNCARLSKLESLEGNEDFSKRDNSMNRKKTAILIFQSNYGFYKGFTSNKNRVSIQLPPITPCEIKLTDIAKYARLVDEIEENEIAPVLRVTGESEVFPVYRCEV